MVKFQELMHVLHSSIREAVNLAESEGMNHISKFFDYVDLEHIEDEYNFVHSETLSDLVASNHNATNNDNSPNKDKVLVPKMVKVMFREPNANGLKPRLVGVPLITLTPLSTHTIEDIEIKSSFEIVSDEHGDLLVGFPENDSSFFSSSASKKRGATNTEINIKFSGKETPKGLTKIIESYERSLRAQLPS